MSEKLHIALMLTLLFVVIAFVSTIALAHDYNQIPYYGGTCCVGDTTGSTEAPKGYASGLAASQVDFDFSTYSWQAGLGFGTIDSNDAYSLSVGKRVQRVLLKGTVTTEDGDTGYGVGLKTQFGD